MVLGDGEAALERRRRTDRGRPRTPRPSRRHGSYIAKVFDDRPDLAAAVTPNYPFWGKRTIFSSDFYPALKQPNVELVPRAVTSITARGVVDADGVERDADVLVLSTGFQPTNYLAHLEVVGRAGESIQKYWDGEPRAFLGVTVPDVPELLHALRAGHERRRDRAEPAEPGRVRAARGEAHDPRGRHRRSR